MVRRSCNLLCLLAMLGLALFLGKALVGSVPAQEINTPSTEGGPAQKSPSHAQATKAQDAYLQVFAQAVDLIEENYAVPKPTKELVYGAIQGVVGTLDVHSAFMTPEEFKELDQETKGKFGGIGIEITMKDRVLTVVSPIEGTPAYRAGIQSGDIIVKINGALTKNMKLSEAVRMIRGPKGSKVTLTINRQGLTQPKDYPIVREIIPIRSVKARIFDDGIGYIRIVSFQAQTDPDFRDYLKKMQQRLVPFKGLILDLRNNPGGLLDQAVHIADEFLSSGLIVYTKGRDRQHYFPFTARPGQEGEKGNFPLIVLINEGSASASEIVAGALKDQKRALIMGTKSFGKASVQSIIELEDGSALRLTTALYYTPNGHLIQEKGIIPDIEAKEPEVPPGKTLEKLREEAQELHMRREGLTDRPWDQPITPAELDRDPVLKKAVDIMRHWPPKIPQKPQTASPPAS